MSTQPKIYAHLPVRGKLTLAYIVSLLIAALMALASLTGLLNQTAVYPSEELRQSFVPNDVVNLFIGLPILLGSMWLARRGRLIGVLFWPGALFYVFYSYLIYVFCMPLSVVFLLYLALVMLSVYMTITLVASIDGEVVKQRLNGAVVERSAGIILVGLGLIYFLRVIALFAIAINSQAPMSNTELALNLTDFFISPAWIVGGWLLWHRKAFGYVAGLGLLFQLSMLFISLITLLIMRPFITSAPFAPIDLLVIFAMAMICFVPFVLFVRGAVAKGDTTTTSSETTK